MMREEKLVYNGKLLRLFKRSVLLPNGNRAKIEIIRHPGAVLAVPFLNKNKIVFLRQYRPVIRSYLYELPAGTLKKGESPAACVRREIIEETGFSARKFRKLGFIYPVPGYSTEKIIIYKAEGLVEAQSSPEKDEVITTCIVTRKQVMRMFKSAKLKDAKSICALAMCGWL